MRQEITVPVCLSQNTEMDDERALAVATIWLREEKPVHFSNVKVLAYRRMGACPHTHRLCNSYELRFAWRQAPIRKRTPEKVS